MTAAAALDWYREMLFTALIVAGPPILAIVVVGLVMAVIQAATQGNDQAVAFAPKALAAVAALTACGAWMLTQLAEFMTASLSALSSLHP